MPLSSAQTALIAAAVIATGGAIAVTTGVVPNPFETAKQAETTAPAKPAEAAKKPAAARTTTAKARPAVCHECGTVASIESFTEKGQATGGGAIAGGVIGGIIGHQIGGGRGKDLATVAGAVGGAVAGHEIEKNVKKVTRYRVTLRMDDGASQVLTLDAANNVAVGDKVRIVDGMLVRN